MKQEKSAFTVGEKGSIRFGGAAIPDEVKRAKENMKQFEFNERMKAFLETDEGQQQIIAVLKKARMNKEI